MIRHGHYLGYDTDGCRCLRCRAAHARYMVHWRANGSTGYDDPDRVSAHIERLIGSGWTVRTIAAEVGLAKSTVHYWRTGETRPSRRLSRRVLELTPKSFCEDCGDESLAGGRWCHSCFYSRSKPVSLSGHGTDAGYTRHRRNGTDPCDACRDAHTVANAERAERRAS